MKNINKSAMAFFVALSTITASNSAFAHFDDWNCVCVSPINCPCTPYKPSSNLITKKDGQGLCRDRDYSGIQVQRECIEEHD